MGYWSPGYIYDMGVRSFHVRLSGSTILAQRFIRAYGEEAELPIVWDREYLKLTTSFIRKLGERYSNDTEVLALVHLSGPTLFSAEPILARDDSELELLRKQVSQSRLY